MNIFGYELQRSPKPPATTPWPPAPDGIPRPPCPPGPDASLKEKRNFALARTEWERDTARVDLQDTREELTRKTWLLRIAGIIIIVLALALTWEVEV